MLLIVSWFLMSFKSYGEIHPHSTGVIFVGKFAGRRLQKLKNKSTFAIFHALINKQLLHSSHGFV